MLQQINETTSFGTVWNNWQTQWTGTQTQTGNWIRTRERSQVGGGLRQFRTITSTTTENQNTGRDNYSIRHGQLKLNRRVIE